MELKKDKFTDLDTIEDLEHTVSQLTSQLKKQKLDTA